MSVEVITSKQDKKGFSYVFPGQGSQSVGMGLELFHTSAAARAVFEEADDSLDFSLSRVIFEGPSRELQDTMNSQPAIMVVSIACWKAWEEILGSQSPRPVSVAGHSLGEYTSLVVAGVVSFRDGVRLVRERGRLMHEAAEARPGGMAAIIGLDEFALQHICAETGVELANVNSDEQVVISGDKLAVARAMDLADSRGAKKTVPLKVSGAFHSSLMGLAQQGLVSALTDLELQDPAVPIIANSLAAPVTTAAQVRDELINGLCHCVHWKQSVRYMVDSGASHFVEFGPARVLSSLIKRIDREVAAFTLSDPASIQKLTEEI